MPKKPLILIGLVLVVCVLIYSYRWIFSQTFNPPYFQDFYDHSQWAIPQSPRIMGDGELYQYAGYRLLHGDHPYSVNPEVPPTGKYLYALTLGLWNNAYLFNLPLFLAGLWLLFIIAQKIGLTQREGWLAVLFFATSPLLFSQLGDTALDLFHLVALLIYMVGLTELVGKQKKNSYLKGILITGLGLGLFVGIKFGLFALALGIPLLWQLSKQKRIRFLVPVLGLAGLIYIGSYFHYFWQGHTFVEWLQTQKWVLNFYVYSQAVKNPLVFFSVVFSGQLSWADFARVTEWTLLWPLSTVALISLYFRQKTPPVMKVVGLTGILLAVIFLVVPFAGRYFLLLLPLGILCLTILLRRLPKYLPAVILTICLVQAGLYLLTAPRREVARLNQLLSAHRFDDLYFETTGTASPQTNEDTTSPWTDFSFPIHAFLHEIKSNQATFRVEIDPAGSGAGSIIFTSAYRTPLGQMVFQQPGTIINQQGKWKLVWDWEYIAPHFSPTARIIYQQADQLGGTLTTADGKNLSTGTMLPYFTIIPREITNEPELLTDLKAITGIDPLATRNLIRVDHPYTLNRRIGFVVPAYDKNIYAKLATHPAVLITLENAPDSRVYPQGAIDKKYVPTIRHLEQTLPELTNFIQGKIEIQSDNQPYRIYTSPPTVPVDVVLPQTVDQLFGTDAQIVF